MEVIKKIAIGHVNCWLREEDGGLVGGSLRLHANLPCKEVGFVDEKGRVFSRWVPLRPPTEEEIKEAIQKLRNSLLEGERFMNDEESPTGQSIHIWPMEE